MHGTIIENVWPIAFALETYVNSTNIGIDMHKCTREIWFSVYTSQVLSGSTAQSLVINKLNIPRFFPPDGDDFPTSAYRCCLDKLCAV